MPEIKDFELRMIFPVPGIGLNPFYQYRAMYGDHWKRWKNVPMKLVNADEFCKIHEEGLGPAAQAQLSPTLEKGGNRP